MIQINEKWMQQREWLINRIRRNLRGLKSWKKKNSVTCYRIYDKDIPEIPLAIDWYEGKLHVAEYRSFADRDAEEQSARLCYLLAGVCEALQVPEENLFYKVRRKQKGDNQYTRQDDSGNRFQVEEDGLQFEVNLSDYLDTGLFLDHRTTRRMIRERAQGKRFLNLFAYTGSFTVYAAAGGAVSTTTVDLSSTYLDWAVRNFSLNCKPGPQHSFVKSDVIQWLYDTLRAGNQRFDLVVCDPPTFSNSKQTSQDFDVQLRQQEMLGLIVKLTAPGGEIFFSTNSTRFRLTAELPGTEVSEISEETVPEDFRNRRIHRCWRIKVHG